MELVTLLLLGISLLFYLISLLVKHNREICLGGSITAVLAICSALTETWDNYTIFVLCLAVYLCSMLLGGALIDYDRE